MNLEHKKTNVPVNYRICNFLALVCILALSVYVPDLDEFLAH